MAYKCNSCGNIMDTDTALRTLEELPPDLRRKVRYAPPSKCNVCGSTNISQVSEEELEAEFRKWKEGKK